MVEADIALASSIYSSPGIYAILIGSGVSRSASIPTGWEVTLDLIERVAAALEESTRGEPESWYREEFGEDPSYSNLLDRLASTSSDRRNLLGAYFEPSEEELDEGKKVPTDAHRAIASLVKGGFVRVILTTNFDRLMERALEDVGISPQVISSDDQIQGSAPLAHSKCTVVKVHGDYQDSRIRNTSDELKEYSNELNQLLDRVFDEYGLVIAGWSAEWDEALAAAIERCPTRRYGTYWAVRDGTPKEAAARLIANRAARVIDISDADSFFRVLANRTEALEQRGSDPESTEIAVTTLKRYLPRPEHRIDLEDLLLSEAKKVRGNHALTADHKMSYLDYVDHLAGITERLAVLFGVAAYFGNEESDAVLGKAMDLVLNHPHRQSGHPRPDMERTPALILTASASLTAVAAGRREAISRMLSGVSFRAGSTPPEPGIEAVAHWHVLHQQFMEKVYRPGENNKYKVPGSRWLRDRVAPFVRDLVSDEDDYEAAFDDYEYFTTLLYSFQRMSDESPGWFGVGEWVVRHPRWEGEWENPNKAAARFKMEIESLGEDWPPLTVGAFGGSLEMLRKIKSHVDSEVAKPQYRFL